MHLSVSIEEGPSAVSVIHEQLSEHEIVTRYFVLPEEPVQARRMRLPIRQETNPDGGVDKGHQAARLLAEGDSRRLGTGLAAGSEPRSARSRS
jgi:hypothetical protein